MAETLTTELEAVNVMLRCIGEAPVNSITGSVPAEVQVAVDTLREVSRKVQLIGWDFNSEEEVELTRALDNTVTLGSNVLKADLSLTATGMGSAELVSRGLKLYDKKNHTYILTANPKCDIVYFLSWNELPEAAREYIKIKAARVFSDGTVGGEAIHQFTSQEELEAFQKMTEHEAESVDATIFDNWDIGSIVYRRRVQTV